MIVERFLFTVKPGKVQEAIELLSAYNWHRPYRLYSSRFGAMYQLSSDIQFENMADNEQYWNKLESEPEFKEFFEKWTSLIVAGKRMLLKPVEASRQD